MHLFNSVFTRYWLSALLSISGSAMTYMALPMLTLSHIGGVGELIWVMVSLTFTQAVFMVVGGGLADSIGSLRLLFISKVTLCITMLGLTWLFFWDALTFPILFILAALMGSFSGMNISAGQASIPSLVESSKIAQGNAVIISTTYISQIIGPLLGAVLVFVGDSYLVELHAGAGLLLAFGVDAALLLIAAIILVGLGHRDCDKTGEFWKELGLGVSFCIRNKIVLTVLSYIAVVSFFLHGPLHAALPVIGTIKLDLSSTLFSVSYAMLPLGVLLGSLIAVIVQQKIVIFGGLVLGCDLLAGIYFIALGEAITVYQVFLLLILCGVSTGIISVLGTTWFQVRIPLNLMGRVMGILMLCVIGLMPISILLSGYVIDYAGVDVLLFSCGVALIFTAICGFLYKPFRMIKLHGEINEQYL